MKQYKNNIKQIEQILNFLESNDYNSEIVNKKVNEGLIKIEESLKILEKPEGKIKIISENKGKINLKNFS